MAISVSLSGKGNHLVFREVAFDKFGIQKGENKVGILAIKDSTKGDATLKQAKKMKWELGDEADDAGFYAVLRMDEEENED